MNKLDKVRFIATKLEELYPEVDIPLESSDPFTHLVAVVLSAQCTDVRVNKITPTLFAQARTPEQMVALPVETIEEIIRPCGLAPGKSKAISKFSRLLLERHQGQVPCDLDALEALPGVGHKTAQVVLAQNFGISTFPVDTHIHRLAWRWTLSNGRNVERTEKDLKRLFPKASWNKLHLQIIYFGREYCPARGHDFDRCPVCNVVGRRSLRS